MSELSTQQLADQIATTLELNKRHIKATLELLDDGCTVPFIARYRKEQTGELDEVQIRAVQASAEKTRALEKRRASILSSLADQNIQNKTLLKDIREAADMVRLEDLYAPYRPRRQTRAQKALAAGLGQLATDVRDDRRGAANDYKQYICDAYPDQDAVLAGVIDIIAEEIADDIRVRDFMREKLRKFGRVESKKKRGADEDPTYQVYLDFSGAVSRLKPHQLLALRRGEKDGALSVKFVGEQDRWSDWLKDKLAWAQDRKNRALVESAVDESYKRLIFPQTERAIRADLEEAADQHAIDIFALNLKNLLLQAPLPGKRVLGLDPGLRTGCKLAVIDEFGDVVDTGVCYVHDRRRDQAGAQLAKLIDKHRVEIVAIGNGTGSSEAQRAATDALELARQPAQFTVVNEAGASVYSASEVARAELPELDVSIRGAVSIARRLQDPLAELVKIDPKSIGVGMYQHDVNQVALASALDAVIEDVVNSVGVDLNSASESLLAKISGIGPKLAGRIVAWRAENGGFASRSQLLKVSGLGAKTYEQCAGFLRIRDGKEILDNTGIHPERYKLAKKILREADASQPGAALRANLTGLFDKGALDDLAASFGVGRPTLRDIVADLGAPGRDPREDLDAPKLRAKILTMEELEPGMRMDGVVRNVVDFGAFVDIGVKQDGLVHVSKMANERIRSPYDRVSLGQRVEVVVMEVDKKRGRISLSMID